MESGPNYMLVIQRVFEAPRSRVWEAWTSEEMEDWGCPENITCSDVKIDLRVGGKYSLRMEEPNGKEHRLSGHYREIRKNERLVFTHVWEGNKHAKGDEPFVTVIFRSVGSGKTKMSFTHENLVSEESLEGHREGWSESFDKLEALLLRRPTRAS